ncbi:MAG TPA: saccharopine dehydrogenase NADP-binding domain-containing protein, partial [Steroidobacteraceae bacterium]|nr:saccharopine dehydrogenase NADP-binding domain-containing protein [Steroidobacteraceae bacterium]
MKSTPHQVVVFGATSFVGQLLTRYLFEEFGAGDGLNWAIAGRSAPKLAGLRDSLGPAARGLEIILADAAAEAALGRMCARAAVVVSTVGPYALYGSPLVKVCAQSGTDYCDLTGEPHWIARMLRAHEGTARRSGARIVHCCGFDSIPSDLGVQFLQEHARRRFGQPCTRVKMRVRHMSGGFSGGTIASGLNAIKEAAGDPVLRRELADPYLLCPSGYANAARQPEVRFAEYDPDFGAWVAPFMMGAINTRIVQRTNALLDRAYGADFRYDEATLAGRGLSGRLTATALAAGMAGFAAAGALGPIRSALESFVLPKPGEGPSAEQQARGRYDLRLLGVTADGQRLRARVTGDRDPGYGSTSKMLGQAAA